MVWVDLVTPDLATAERFYGALLGWTFQSVHRGASAYSVALMDGHPVGGLFEKAVPAGEHRQSVWMTFFAVRDVEISQSKG